MTSFEALRSRDTFSARVAVEHEPSEGSNHEIEKDTDKERKPMDLATLPHFVLISAMQQSEETSVGPHLFMHYIY